MGPLDDIILRGILSVDSNGKVLQKEDAKIEYKEIFDKGSKEAKAKYAKEMAALYNYEGGYLIFGVSNSGDLLGLQSFTEPDNAELVDDINSFFSPAIKFHSRLVKLNGKDVFVIHVEKRTSIPTVCIKGHQDAVKESTIYWRYSAKSSPIGAGDLINLLGSLKGEDSKELTEIAKKDFRSKFKPRLWLNGGVRTDGEVHLRIENRGEIAHVDGFNIVESNSKEIWPPTWKNHPIIKEHGVEAVVRSNTHWTKLSFKLAMDFHDDEGHRYRSIIDFKDQRGVLETTEL